MCTRSARRGVGAIPVNAKQVVLELLPSRLDVIRFSGTKRLDATRIPLSLPSDPNDWCRALGRAAGQVRDAAGELGVLGHRAIVFYRSPTQSVDLLSLSGTGNEILEAARLQLAGDLPYDSELAVCRVVTAARDAENGHVIAAAERDDIAEAIGDFVVDAGFKLESATPVEAAVLGQLVATTVDSKCKQAGVLYMGEHATFFLVIDQGNLVFSRHVRIGLDSIATALTRPINTGGAEPVELDATVAREILHTYGRPDPKRVLPEADGLRGGQLLSVMQPVLQRMIVELRQSLRFGLTEEQRQRLSITLAGPGSTLPGFADLLTTELGVEVAADERYTRYAWKQPGCGGSEIVDVANERWITMRLNLLSSSEARTRSFGRMRKWLVAGAAVASTVVGFDAFRANARLNSLREQVSVAESQSQSQEQLRTTQERLGAMLSTLGTLEGQIMTEIGRRPDYKATLHELSRSIGHGISLTSIQLSQLEGATEATIEGSAVVDETGRTSIEGFIATMNDSPLFESVTLGSVNAGMVDGREAELFEARFHVRSPARDGMLESIAAGMMAEVVKAEDTP